MANYMGPTGWNLGGAILQIAQDHTFINTEIQVSAGSYYNFTTVNITPKSSSSSLLVFANPRFYSREGDRYGSGNTNYGNTYLFLQDITNNTQVNTDKWLNYSDQQFQTKNTDGLRLRYPVFASFTNNVTTQRQFRCRAQAQGGFAYGRVGGDGTVSTIILEIEA